jgi:hypothetical protein
MPSVIGSGYAVVAPTLPPGVITLLYPPAGGSWAWIQQPRTLSYNGWTYVGFVHSSGAVKVVAINESTGAAGTPITVHTYSVDNHNNPALWVRPSDHKLLVVYSGHNASQIYRRFSTTSLDTDPDLGDGFAAETGLYTQLGSWATFTYPILLQLTDETSDPIYLFWRERHGTDRLRYSKSTDGGVTWGTSIGLAVADTAGTSMTYWGIATNGTDRYDVFWCDFSDGADSQMHHFYYTAGNYRKSDGTLIISDADLVASAGVDALDKGDMTLVVSNAAGAVDRVMGPAWDGAPAALALQRNGSTDNRIVSARWRSGAWQVDTVVDSVGGSIAGNLYQSGASFAPTDPDIAVVAQQVSGRWEMFRHTSGDDGVTWTPEALTSGSAADNFNPAMVWDGSVDLQAVWCYGTFTDNTLFSLGLRGVVP